MQGYVLAYRPATGEGSIVTGSGRTIRFAGIADDPTLHGGDWVSLFLSESDSAGHPTARVRVIKKWSNSSAPPEGAAPEDLMSALRLSAHSL